MIRHRAHNSSVAIKMRDWKCTGFYLGFRGPIVAEVVRLRAAWDKASAAKMSLSFVTIRIQKVPVQHDLLPHFPGILSGTPRDSRHSNRHALWHPLCRAGGQTGGAVGNGILLSSFFWRNRLTTHRSTFRLLLGFIKQETYQRPTQQILPTRPNSLIFRDETKTVPAR